MKAEIITIGDEILIGQIVDTNSAWLGQQLNPLGWEITRITTISDTIDEITSAVDTALNRSDLVIMTGGLGPTKDDVTKSALCTYFNTELVFDEATYVHVEKLFRHFKREVSEVNRNQAYIPANAKALFNRFGTAPGMWFKTDRGILVSLPGVPYEMKCIIEDEVIPRIQSMSSDVFEHRTIVVSGVPESIISERIASVENSLNHNLKIAYLPHYNVVRVRITGRGTVRQEVEDQLDKAKQQIVDIMDEHVVALTDERIEHIIGKLLHERKQTASFAESCTGGYVAHLVTSIPGCSAYFPGSVVTYSYENKTDVLGVDADILWNKGAVSQEVVEKMATSIRIKNNTDYGLAISGIAGPGGGTDEKPVGTVWMAVSDQHSVISKLYTLRGDRSQNIERSANLALELLRKKILKLI
ncbi:MAG: competence/damage-inducible protein A [Bacteroidia bacterium]|nr:competence/damage-inducible protein A [Bacteroidia bacterium]